MESYKIKFILLAIPLSCFFKPAFSQTSEKKDTISGTYQIQVVNNRNEPFIPGNINQLVLDHRKDEETVYYRLDDIVRIKILSRKEITSPAFQPLKQVEHVAE
jgi:hypothetical protein